MDRKTRFLPLAACASAPFCFLISVAPVVSPWIVTDNGNAYYSPNRGKKIK